MHMFPDASPDEAILMMDDVRHGIATRWAAENLPAIGLGVVGGMLAAFARATTTAPMPVAERRRIAETARRAAGGAR